MKRIIYGSLSVLTAIGTVFTAAKAEVFDTNPQETITQDEQFAPEALPQDQSVAPAMFGATNSGNPLIGAPVGAKGQVAGQRSLLLRSAPTQPSAGASFSPQLAQVPGTPGTIPAPVAKPSAGAPEGETLTEEEAAVEDASMEAPVIVPGSGAQTLPSPGTGFTPGATTPVVPANGSAQTGVGTPPATAAPTAVPTATPVVPASPVVPAAPDAPPLVPGPPATEADAPSVDSFDADPAADEMPEDGEEDTVDEAASDMDEDDAMESDGFGDGSPEMESDGFDDGLNEPDAEGMDEDMESDEAPADVFTAPVPAAPNAPTPDGGFTPGMPPAEAPAEAPSEAPLGAPTESAPVTPLPSTPVAPPAPTDSFEPSEGDAFEEDSFDSSTPLGSTSDRLIGEGFSPFQLSYLAIGGGLKEAGIPGGDQLLDAYESGAVSAEDIVNAGAVTKRLGTDANDEADYTKGVDKFLKLLSRQSLSS